jgi:hypothetical protein
MTGGQAPGFSPADVARRVAALGVIIDPATVWAYLRGRFAAAYPERAGAMPPALLPVAASELDEWLDGLLDAVDAERARLTRLLHRDLPC